MKKFIQYLRSPKSDILLFVLLLILANLVVSRSYFRIDLTSPKSYSLSKGSQQVVKTLEEPLSVKVFFSDNLNAPYSSVYQYIKDILLEYKASANGNFSYEFVDMTKPENEKIARSYGLNQIQIQELKNNEVGFKQVWMGLALLYADRIEALDSLSSTEGLEYKITTTISNMISTTSALAGLAGNVNLTLYASKKLADFQIIGFNELEDEVKKAYSQVNKKNQNRIIFNTVDPNSADIQNLVEKYGIQSLNWNGPDGTSGQGALGLVMEYGEKFTAFPLRMGRDLFGRNMITGAEGLSDQIQENLKSLVSKSQEIGYITGHGEVSLTDQQGNQASIAQLISDRYTFKEINLKEEEIPSSLMSIVIDGPHQSFTDEELYKIDQFVLRGGNLLVFADPFEENIPEGQMAYYQQPAYTPLNTGIEKNLEKYGIKLEKNYVYDVNSYTANDRRYGKLQYYFAPMMQKNSMDSKNPVTKNLGYVIFFQNGAINVDSAKENKNAKVTVLAKSSDRSWTIDKNIVMNPTFISVPSDSSSMKSENLAVLVEGKFESAFSSNPGAKEESKDGLASNEHLSKSVQNSRIIVVSSSIVGGGTSKSLGAQLLDGQGAQPVSMFVRNAVDYLNGEEDLCTMRTKGLGLDTLTVKSQALANFAKYFNEIGLVLLVALVGLFVLLKIRAKKNAIRQRYNPNDTRIEEKK